MSDSLRVDKWLWHARFFKTRTLAAKVVTSGAVRLNSVKIAKASVTVSEGDVLTFPQARDVRVIKVVAIGTRRGPAPEAQALYEDLTPPAAPTPPGADNPERLRRGRPTKKQRRELDAMRRSDP